MPCATLFLSGVQHRSSALGGVAVPHTIVDTPEALTAATAQLARFPLLATRPTCGLSHYCITVRNPDLGFTM